MARIPLVCVALLLASVFAMQLTTQQTNVFYVPATEGPVKFRPANLTGPMPQVVDLQEADRRHKEIYGTDVTEPYAYDDSEFLLGSCGPEIELILVTDRLSALITG